MSIMLNHKELDYLKSIQIGHSIKVMKLQHGHQKKKNKLKP